MQRALDDNRPMTAEQAATLKRLANAAYELDAFKPNLTRAEADQRIAALTAKLKLLDAPPHTLLSRGAGRCSAAKSCPRARRRGGSRC
jgi:hypothetical protein